MTVYARSVSLLVYPMVVYARSISLLAQPTVVYASSDRYWSSVHKIYITASVSNGYVHTLLAYPTTLHPRHPC